MPAAEGSVNGAEAIAAIRAALKDVGKQLRQLERDHTGHAAQALLRRCHGHLDLLLDNLTDLDGEIKRDGR